MEEFYVGYKMTKPIDGKPYPSMSKWCNENNCWIEDRGDYYEVCSWSEKDLKVQMLQSELSELEGYLSSTDYMVIKCLEIGLIMQSEYPDDFTKRQQARDRINAIMEELNNA